MSRGPTAQQSDWDTAEAKAVMLRHAGRPGAMLPILHELQAIFGYIHAEAVPLIADALNVSKAEVRGVVSFYHDFRHEPVGRHILKICRAEACQSMGVERVLDHLSAHHGLALGDTTPDRRLTIEAVYCLGNCALSPAALLDDELIGRFDEVRLDAIVRGEPEAVA